MSFLYIRYEIGYIGIILQQIGTRSGRHGSYGGRKKRSIGYFNRNDDRAELKNVKIGSCGTYSCVTARKNLTYTPLLRLERCVYSVSECIGLEIT